MFSDGHVCTNVTNGHSNIHLKIDFNIERTELIDR